MKWPLGPCPSHAASRCRRWSLGFVDAAGVHLRVGEQRTVDGIWQVSAFEVQIDTSDGPAILSLGHAEASAEATRSDVATVPEPPGRPRPARRLQTHSPDLKVVDG